jgi:hypothetical protein
LKLMGCLDALREVANKKLFMMQSLFHMDLHPEQPHGWIKVPGTLLYVAKFSGDTKTEAIVNTFTSAGYPLTSIEVHWIDGESTFVSVNTADGPETIIPSLKFPTDWEIISYEDYELRRQEQEEAAKKAKAAEAAAAAETALASHKGAAGGSSLVKMVDDTVHWLVHIKDTIVDTVVGHKRSSLSPSANAIAAGETDRASASAGNTTTQQVSAGASAGAGAGAGAETGITIGVSRSGASNSVGGAEI